MNNIQFILAARYLWGRRLRTFLTTLAIVIGTLMIFGMNMMLPTMIKAFQSNLLAASGQVDITITHASGEAFSEKALNRVRAVSGVRVVNGSLSRTINIPSGFFGRARVTALTLTGIEPRTAQMVRTYKVKAGRFLRSSDEEAAVITTSLADSLGLSLGDTLNLPTTEGVVRLKIVGLLPERALPGNEEVLVSLYEAQKLLDLPDRINTIEINLDTVEESERQVIQNQIQALLGKEYNLGTLASGTEIFASMKIGQAAFNLFGFLALFMGAFIIFNTFRTIVAERRHDIGMLRAIGASRKTIIGLFIVEGFLQGAIGTLVGIFLGYLMGVSILKLMGPLLDEYLHLEMGAPVIQPGLLPITMVLGIGVTLLAGLLPAFNASRLTPLDALRPAVVEGTKRLPKAGLVSGLVLIALAALALLSGEMSLTALGGLLFLIGLVLVGPALVRPIATAFSTLISIIYARDGAGDLARGNLIRQPTRAAITASSTMIGLAIIIAMGGLVWSLTGGFLDILRRSLGSDYLIMPPSVGVWSSNVGARPELAEELRNIPGVEAVSTMRFASATANGKAVVLLGIDPMEYPKVASLTFQQGDPQQAYPALGQGRNLIANGVFAAQVGLKVGDVVRLSTPTGEKPYQIIAVAGDYLNAKIMTAYISQANLQADFRKDEDVFIQLNLAPAADVEKVEARLKKALQAYPQFKLVSGQSYYEENRQLFYAVFAFYFVLLGVLTMPSLIAILNTLAIGVIERTREIGMLRAIGATRKQVRRVVVGESLLLAAIGTSLGILAGLYLGYVLVLGLSVSGFAVEYSFPYVGILAGIAIGLIFGVIAAAVPARQAARMEIIRALRYE